MERLTEVENGTAMVKGCGSNCKYGFEYCRKEDWENCKTIDDVIDKLAQYETLEEQGLLLRLPVKVGDTIWRIFISDNYIMPCNVEEFVYSNSLYIIVREEFFNTRRGLNIDEIGKTVFLTKAEAEQKLREMESD